MLQDQLKIAIHWHGEVCSLHQGAEFIWSFLETLEEISPWESEFKIVVKSKEVEVDREFSSFEEIFLESLDDEYHGFLSSMGEEVSQGRDAFCQQGIDVTIVSNCNSNGVNEGVTIRFYLQSTSERRLSSILTDIPEYLEGQVNELWSSGNTIYPLFNYILDYLMPEQVFVFSSQLSKKILGQWGRKDKYELGWISYTKNTKLKPLFEGEPFFIECKNGCLLEFGKSRSVFDREEAIDNMKMARDKLRGNDLFDWKW